MPAFNGYAPKQGTVRRVGAMRRATPPKFSPCIDSRCPCAASHDGKALNHCCWTCFHGQPCKRNYHKVPFTGPGSDGYVEPALRNRNGDIYTAVPTKSKKTLVKFVHFSRKLSKTWKKQNKKNLVNCKLVAPRDAVTAAPITQPAVTAPAVAAPITQPSVDATVDAPVPDTSIPDLGFRHDLTLEEWNYLRTHGTICDSFLADQQRLSDLNRRLNEAHEVAWNTAPPATSQNSGWDAAPTAPTVPTALWFGTDRHGNHVEGEFQMKNDTAPSPPVYNVNGTTYQPPDSPEPPPNLDADAPTKRDLKIIKQSAIACQRARGIAAAARIRSRNTAVRRPAEASTLPLRCADKCGIPDELSLVALVFSLSDILIPCADKVVLAIQKLLHAVPILSAVAETQPLCDTVKREMPIIEMHMRVLTATTNSQMLPASVQMCVMEILVNACRLRQTYVKAVKLDQKTYAAKTKAQGKRAGKRGNRSFVANVANSQAQTNTTATGANCLDALMYTATVDQETTPGTCGHPDHRDGINADFC